MTIVRPASTRARTLPAADVRDAVRRGRSMPHSVMASRPQPGIDQEISGRIARLGRTVFAVPCPIEGVSHVDVDRGGEARCASTLERASDTDPLADGGRNGVAARAYGRGIDRATQAAMASYRKDPGGPPRPDRRRDGIANAHDHASILRYGARDRWVQLRGMD